MSPADDIDARIRNAWRDLWADPLLRIEDVCSLLGITRGTAWRWARTGHMKVVRIAGTRMRVRRSEVMRLCDALGNSGDEK